MAESVFFFNNALMCLPGLLHECSHLQGLISQLLL